MDKKLDIAWSKLVKLLAGERCEVCGEKDSLASHHIFTRSKKSTRWDVLNGLALCYLHHVESSSFSAHKTPEAFLTWLESYRGTENIDDLRLKSNTAMKLMEFEKEEMLLLLEKEIIDIKKARNEIHHGL